jgi:hypothetical protein
LAFKNSSLNLPAAVVAVKAVDNAVKAVPEEDNVPAVEEDNDLPLPKDNNPPVKAKIPKNKANPLTSRRPCRPKTPT